MSKLFLFQSKVESIKKDSKNPHFGNRYFDINTLIETVKPILNEIGLILVQPIKVVEGKTSIYTALMDKDDGKILLDSVFPLIEMSDPQKVGGCITYFRRYALQSMLLLEAEDDDGETASGRPPVYQNATPTNFSSQVAREKYAQVNEKKVGDVCPDCGAKFVKWTSGNIGCGAKCFVAENKHLRDEYKASKSFAQTSEPVADLPVIQVEQAWGNQPEEDKYPG